MKFVDEHLSKDHLKRRPHRWLLALLLSPIHAAEMDYKKRYHLTFVHAKKVFFFDVSLVLGMLVLFAAVVFWFTFDPTVTKEVALSLTPETHDPANDDQRIRSGEHLTYTIEYQNNSDKTLTNPTLTFVLPRGFVVDEGPQELMLDDLTPGDRGIAMISGFFYEPAQSEHRIAATLRYTQDGRQYEEQKQATVLQVLRGSVIEGVLSAPTAVLTQGSAPIDITLTNTNHHAVALIELPLVLSDEFRIIDGNATHGSIADDIWSLGELRPGEAATLSADLSSRITAPGRERTISIVPHIVVEGRRVAQVPMEQTVTVLRPEATISAAWEDVEALEASGEKQLRISVENTGTTDLTNIRAVFDIPATVNATRLLAKNGGSISLSTYRSAPLAETLAPDETTVIELSVPTNARNAGTDVRMQLSPSIEATVPGIAESAYRSAVAQTSEIPIASNVFFTAESRYYTDEGDQLGRGPLPPEVGKTTKYWAFLSLQNTTSRIGNAVFSAQLPAHVSWTGRSSVSHGADITFDPDTRTVHWSLQSISAHDTIGLFMELGLTPVSSQRGTTPNLLENLTVSGTDIFTNTPIFRSIKAMNSALDADTIGSERGVAVQ